jgi:hypothetical protein
MYLTLEELKEKGCCKRAYTLLAKSLGGVRKFGKTTPIPAVYLLDVLGLTGFLWLEKNVDLSNKRRFELSVYKRTCARRLQKHYDITQGSAEDRFARMHTPSALKCQSAFAAKEVKWQIKELRKILVRWQSETDKRFKSAITHLRNLGTEKVWPNSRGDGICAEIAALLGGTDSWEYYIICDAMTAWPDYSGSKQYPVPSNAPSLLSPSDAYHRTGDIWDNTLYGDRRRELCLFVATYLKTMLDNIKRTFKK